MSDRAAAALICSLDSADKHERAEAAVRLGQQRAVGALPRLRMLTRDQDDIVALAAMYACWQLGDDFISTQRVIDALGSGEEECVQQAIEIVCAIGAPMIDKLTPLLRGSSAEAKLALRALDDIHESAARQAIDSMKSGDPELRALQQSILEDWDDAAAGER